MFWRFNLHEKKKTTQNHNTRMPSLRRLQGRRLAVDVGCGSGQSTLVLSPHFRRLVGLDVSSSQLAEAERRRSEAGAHNVKFRSGLNKHHWFADKKISTS